MTTAGLTKVKFAAKISSQGNNLVIWIPRSYHEMLKELRKKKQVMVTLDDSQFE